MPRNGDKARIYLKFAVPAFWDAELNGGCWVLDRTLKIDSVKPDHPRVIAIEELGSDADQAGE